ncbi:hypothetical protein KAR91_12050 [Candidatus Pacearchaeota archaeon]|nr:hypothetical protein [Candidatus Pacearchaeota archaeon]
MEDYYTNGAKALVLGKTAKGSESAGPATMPWEVFMRHCTHRRLDMGIEYCYEKTGKYGERCNEKTCFAVKKKVAAKICKETVALCQHYAGSASVCEWSCNDSTDWWQTGCGDEWVIPDGTPKENGMEFCTIW